MHRSFRRSALGAPRGSPRAARWLVRAAAGGALAGEARLRRGAAAWLLQGSGLARRVGDPRDPFCLR